MPDAAHSSAAALARLAPPLAILKLSALSAPKHSDMNHLERVSSILGAILVGVATWIIVLDRRDARARALRPPVGKLAEDLKHAWAPYHTP